MARGYSFGALVAALKGAAFCNVGKTAGTVAAGDDSRIVNAYQKSGGQITGAVSATQGIPSDTLLKASGVGMGNYLPPTQGSHLTWNRDSSSGMMELMNHRGSGSGGFNFWNGNQLTQTKIATLLSNGTLSVSGVLQESGVRVYSPNNKPTPNAIGALPASGNAVSATKLQTARKIAGKSFDGTSDISIGFGDVGALGASQNAVSATKLVNARKIAGKTFDGTQDVPIAPADIGALPATSNAVSATKLQTARAINGVKFDGTADIKLDLGLKVVGLLQFSLFDTRANARSFKATDSSHLQFTIGDKTHGKYVVPGETRIHLRNPAILSHFEGSNETFNDKIGEYLVTAISFPSDSDHTATITIQYVNHGVAVGSTKNFIPTGYIYRSIGLSLRANIANRQSLWGSWICTLSSSLSKTNCPMHITSDTQGYINVSNVKGSKTVMNDDQPCAVNISPMGTDYVNITVADTDNVSTIGAGFITAMVYDFA